MPAPENSPSPETPPLDLLGNPLDSFWTPANLALIPSRAVEMGWVGEEPRPRAEIALIRAAEFRRRVPVEREAEILRLAQRGWRCSDISERLNMQYDTVRAALKRARKRALRSLTAEEARIEQFITLTAVKEQLIHQVLPEPRDDGTMPTVNPKDVDALMKVMNGLAGLTQSKVPQKMEVTITHHEADDSVSKVAEYMDIIDRVMKMGYGSGRTVDVEGWETKGELPVESTD